MPFADIYRRQVALLVRTLPLVAEETCFALKGGTAINLFVRDMPRLSVDIDLTYLPVHPRDESLAAIDAAMKRIAHRIESAFHGARVDAYRHDDAVTSLLVRADSVQIKIEVTPVLRGCAFPPERRRVTGRVEDEFGFAEIQVVSLADLYAGKIVAALDRQHPRDLFDIRDLLRHEGIDGALRIAFIVYLLSHNRPMAEVLGSPQKDIQQEFARGFDGMTDRPMSLDALIAARATLVTEIVGNMPTEHRQFLVSFEAGTPEWDLIDVPKARQLPAIQWRMRNLDMLAPEKRAALVQQLVAVLKA